MQRYEGTEALMNGWNWTPKMLVSWPDILIVLLVGAMAYAQAL
jgi:hypothetical protein